MVQDKGYRQSSPPFKGSFCSAARKRPTAMTGVSGICTENMDFLQYYAIHADVSTQRLLQSVMAAAERGVRVRVLLDDLHSTGRDAQVMRLALCPMWKCACSTRCGCTQLTSWGAFSAWWATSRGCSSAAQQAVHYRQRLGHCGRAQPGQRLLWQR